MTHAAFVQRLADAEGHFLYTRMNELDQLNSLQTNARTDGHFQIICLAFDFGNRYGQTRVGTQSVSEKVTIRFNWNASTTVKKGKNYFRKVLIDGPISRINFCSIPEREIGAKIPAFGTYGPDFDEELRPYLERLTGARGRVDCPEAFDLALRLREECAQHAQATQSRVYENFSFRANVIAFLKACVLFVANGYVWEPAMEDFVRWSLKYDLLCKMFLFWKDMEREMSDDEAVPARRGPQNLLTYLPDVFTREDVLRLREERGMSANGTPQLLSAWKTRGYIQQLTDKQYKKLKLRNDGMDIDPNA